MRAGDIVDGGVRDPVGAAHLALVVMCCGDAAWMGGV